MKNYLLIFIKYFIILYTNIFNNISISNYISIETKIYIFIIILEFII